MMTEDDIAGHATRVKTALQAAYGVQGKTLSQTVKRAGRRVPRGLQADAGLIVAAQGYGGNPKLLRRADAAALKRAETRLLQHLETVDRRAERVDRILGILGVIAFNVLVILAIVILYVVWRQPSV